MYSEIADVYLEIFPLNHAFLVFITEYLGEPGTRVLDLGCGPGDYVDALASRYEAVGIDNNPEMIKTAVQRNRGTFHQLSFTQIDRLNGGFSCAYCIGNSLSYLQPEMMTDFYRTLYRLLDTGAYFIVQVVNWDKYRLTENVDFDVKHLSDGRTFHRAYEAAEDDAVVFKTCLKKGETVIGEWSDMLHPKYMADMVSGLTASGMAVVDRFGDFKKNPFDPASSPAAVLTARKPV
ncbi:MAG: class I SAM-dependent methyltransferase [Desulfobacterales bacterium]